MSGPRIDLWWFRIVGGAAAERAAMDLLDPAERARLDGFAGADAARLFAIRRAARRVLLAERLGVPPASLAFDAAPGGKPLLVRPSAGVAFSASHAGTTGVIAATGGMPVGVDIEAVRPVDAAALAERILSPAERLACGAAGAGGTGDGERNAMILRAWTAKEALVKAWGTGLDLAAFRRITLDLAARPGGWQAAALGGDLARRGRWHLYAATLPAPDAPEAPSAVIGLAAPEPGPVAVSDAGALLERHGLA